tara:strand:- start:636 stop:1094 length:459 start_codon:yes stop_codon:yes gene_type:complete
MNVNDIKTLMIDIPHFYEMTQEELGLLADSLKYRKIRSGEFIVKEGQVGSTLFYIVSGKVKISVESISEKKKTMTMRGKGTTIGELAVVGLSNIRAGTVTALSDTELLLLSKQAYENLIEKHPRVAFKILKSIAVQLSQRIKELSGQVVDLL